ncbi:MAG TPA: hypothetical protein VKU82_05505 [Planctomycetaceae bacterium]|nr:hypothetical protein [Planctomycetaceae bacterium]
MATRRTTLFCRTECIGAVVVVLAWLTNLPQMAWGQDQPGRAGRPALTIAPPSGLTAQDHPNDDGTAIDLKWILSPDDKPEVKPRIVKGYDIYRSSPDGAKWEKLSQVPYGIDEHTDSRCRRGESYLYEVAAVGTNDLQSERVRLDSPVKRSCNGSIGAARGSG